MKDPGSGESGNSDLKKKITRRKEISLSLVTHHHWGIELIRAKVWSPQPPPDAPLKISSNPLHRESIRFTLCLSIGGIQGRSVRVWLRLHGKRREIHRGVLTLRCARVEARCVGRDSIGRPPQAGGGRGFNCEKLVKMNVFVQCTKRD